MGWCVMARAQAIQNNLAGVQAGNYRLLRLLDEGGMCTIWLGFHPLIGAKVAVKILKSEYCTNSSAVYRFITEAQAINRINSSHVVKLFDFGKLPDGRDYAVLELLIGESLANRLSRRRPLSWREASKIILQIVRGMIHVHRAYVIHRDIKPENVFLTNEDQNIHVKILDFGVAKLLEKSHATKLEQLTSLDDTKISALETQNGKTIGTPAYCSPEQLMGEPIDASTDIYAIGCLFYELLTGSPPFDGSVEDVARAKIILRQTPDFSFPVEVPKEIAFLLSTMMAWNKEARPSAKETYQILQDAMTHHPNLQTLKERETSSLIARRTKRIRRHMTTTMTDIFLLKKRKPPANDRGEVISHQNASDGAPIFELRKQEKEHPSEVEFQVKSAEG